MSKLSVGDAAPEFTLPINGGGVVSLSQYRGKKVVLYFYPQDNTQTCTLQAIEFTGKAEAFNKAGAVVIGVSPDSVKSHDRFCAKHGLGITLASDEERKVIEAYGVWREKKTFGITYMGVVRSTFLIDQDGNIARIWDAVRLKNHIDGVLEAAQSL